MYAKKTSKMIVAVDVHYRETVAKAVSVEFQNWEDEVPAQVNHSFIKKVADYEPGLFYKRELPCLLNILKQSDLSAVEAIIVDGYVFLDDQFKPGLGKYLYDALNAQIPIIGVAKRSFKDNDRQVIQIKRGQSDNPLFVTSIGMEVQEAAQRILHMAGAYRMPAILKRLDQETKSE